ncbi:MAG TPA: M55 family metallopeptidase [Candidatus Dormibacteraeota bacterium]|nr:M55 family metallopeptidase [Candidatus Dormibacteraeota bacterium]
MRLYISCDMEGTAGVVDWTQVDPNNASEYPYYRRVMSQEVRAAIEGARSAGARDVLVNDSHWYMRNLLWDELPEDVRVISGYRKPFSMGEGLEGGFDCAFFTGYHAGVGERGGVMDHTYTARVIYDVRVNGVRCSEGHLNAALAGWHGIPVTLITGDRAAVDQLRRELPWVTGVVVKEPIGRFSANSVSPARARALIREGAAEAMRRIAEARPYRFEPPIALELDLVGTAMADVVELIPGFERTAGRSLRFVHEDFPTVYQAFIAAYRLGGTAIDE